MTRLETQVHLPLRHGKRSLKTPGFLKIRILTWNMHDSLPKVRTMQDLRKCKAYCN